MGFETETLLVFKDNASILPTNKKDCDNKPVFTLKKLLSPFIIRDLPFKAALKTITSLDLSNCELVDLPLNSEIFNLKHLNLSHNNFCQVPTCLYNGFKNLEFLDLSHNQISLFEREPDCLSCLESVNLSNNKFPNVPQWFLTFKAVNLREFSYSSNKAKHYKYRENSYNYSINKLTKLDLTNSQLIDKDFSFLRQFKHLRYLDIGNYHEKYCNRFQDIDQLFVNLQWKHLRILRANNLGTAIFPSGIMWLASLVELHFEGNCVSWLPDDIKYMISLEVLEVSNNSLVGLPVSITYLEKLKILKACNNYIEMVPDFSLMTELEVLDLYENSIEEISFDISTVKFLDLERNYLDTKTIHCHLDYEKKKISYRGTLKNIRAVGYKSERPTCESPVNKNSFDEPYFDGGVLSDQTDFSAEEWIIDKEPYQIHGSIYVDSDDDWNDEYRVDIVRVNKQNKERIYVLDEDWMFEDAFEEL